MEKLKSDYEYQVSSLKSQIDKLTKKAHRHSEDEYERHSEQRTLSYNAHDMDVIKNTVNDLTRRVRQLRIIFKSNPLINRLLYRWQVLTLKYWYRFKET